MGFNVTKHDLIVEEKRSLVILGEMAANIAFYNFETRFNTFVIFNYVYLVPMQVFFRLYHPVLVKRGKYVPKNRVKHVPQFVFFGQRWEELQDLVRWLIQNKYDNTAKYILVCVNEDPTACDEKMLLGQLGDIYISNIVFLKQSQDETAEAYTVYPLKPKKCWNTEPVKINIAYGCEYDQCYKNLFPEKYNNLYGCPFIVSTFEQDPFMIYNNNSDGDIEITGRDGDVLALLMKRLNGTLVLRTPIEQEWGYHKDGNWTGCLGDIYNHRAQGAMCSIPLTAAKYGNFQISFTYDSMDMVWAAPMPPLKPSWEKLLYPWPAFLRIITLCMFFVIVLLNTLTKTKFWVNVTKVLHTKPTKSNLLFYSWILFLGMPVVKLPTKFPFRLLVFTWIWYGLIVRSLYQATLISSLKQRFYENKFENFSEVIAKKLPFGGPLTLQEYFVNEPYIYNNWHQTSQEDAGKILDKISLGEIEFVIALNRETVLTHLMKHPGTRSVNILPEKIVNSPTVIFFKHFSHMCNPVSKLLTSSIENGFTQRLHVAYAKQAQNVLKRPNTHQAEPLQMVHVTGLFILLMIGWFLAGIFFVIELACGRYKD